MLSAEKLKYLRLLHGITQVELGKELGISRNYISMVEHRKENFTEEWCNNYVNAIYRIATRKQNEKNINEIQELKEDVEKIKNNSKTNKNK